MQGLNRTGKQPTIWGVNLVYLSVLVLMIGVQAVSLKWLPQREDGANYYARLAILEILLIGLPALIYMLVTRINIAKTVRYNRIKPAEILLVLGMAVFGYGVTLIINLIWYFIISQIGTPIGQELPVIETGSQLLAALLAIGLVPAMVEEFLFRGLILRGYERLGAKGAILITGVLFGMLHLQLMTIPTIILLGIVISYVVYRTDSIFAGVIYHFVHNAATVCILFVQNWAMDNMGGAETLPQDLSQLPKEELVVAIIAWSVIGLFSLVLFAIFATVFHRCTKNKGRIRAVGVQELRRSTFFEIAPALVAAFIVLVSLVTEILYMSGVLNL
ncbi:MAG: CPBP family intramembrane metalloprotease [Clostridiales bacterium]|nr:CPBP family intramembrane metalloprotease [Clostridiales bacterium]